MGTRLNADGAKIKMLRVQRGWTQEQLAGIAGVSPRTVQRAEAANGAAFETLRAIAVAFEIDFDQLLRVDSIDEPEKVTEPSSEPFVTLATIPANWISESIHHPAPPARSSWLIVPIASVALAAGLFAGMWFSYRLMKPVDTRVNSRILSDAHPSKPEITSRIVEPNPVPENQKSAGIPSSTPFAAAVSIPKPSHPGRSSAASEIPDAIPEFARIHENAPNTTIPLTHQVSPLDLPSPSSRWMPPCSLLEPSGRALYFFRFRGRFSGIWDGCWCSPPGLGRSWTENRWFPLQNGHFRETGVLVIPASALLYRNPLLVPYHGSGSGAFRRILRFRCSENIYAGYGIKIPSEFADSRGCGACRPRGNGAEAVFDDS